MNNEKRIKVDRRTEYTQSLIRDTLFDLMESTPIDKITVRRLCEEAGINRSTFYSHYKDVWDVVEQITKKYYAEVSVAIAETLTPEASNSSLLKLSSLVFGTEYGIKILRHPEIFIFGEQHELIDQSYIDYMQCHTTLSKKEVKYLYAFITYGLMGMAKQMLLHKDFHEMIDIMDDVYRSLISEGLKQYTKKET